MRPHMHELQPLDMRKWLVHSQKTCQKRLRSVKTTFDRAAGRYHMTSSVLVGDVGATNARFALVSNGNLNAISTFEVAKFGQFADVLAIFLKEHCSQTQIHQAFLAIAGPVIDERVPLTNSSWVIDAGELQTGFGLQVRIVNDFEAVALSLPSLTSTDLAQIGGGRPEVGAPMAVLGPGSGLGVACLIDRGYCKRRRPCNIGTDLRARGSHHGSLARTLWPCFRRARHFW